MSVSRGKVVQMNYILRNKAGDVLDRSEEGEAFDYLHGADQIVPGLEKALEGLKIGDKKKVTVQPSEGYGEMIPQLQAELQRSAFPKDMPIEVGIEFRANLEDGPAVLRIVEVNGDLVKVDGNHPLAGETLEFDIEIVGLRDATKDEMEHGHAHGPDGHHH
jgi:FKBP-type peptidyl-prolyl cis-trans isomerase SlyD